jgi:hypothetical protein
LKDIKSDLTLRIKPFAKTALNQVSTTNPPGSDFHIDSDIGLEDVKYRISSDFTVDFTVNTDFAEADVDAQVLNLTRFRCSFQRNGSFSSKAAGFSIMGPEAARHRS